MLDFNEYFKDEYQIALKEVNYKIIENEIQPEEIQISFQDKLGTNIEDRYMEIVFCRKVYFEPEAIYSLSVIFSVIAEFKEEIDIDSLDFEWEKELKSSPNPYLVNAISRASNIISMLTSSYGQQPLITPPSFIDETFNE